MTDNKARRGKISENALQLAIASGSPLFAVRGNKANHIRVFSSTNGGLVDVSNDVARVSALRICTKKKWIIMHGRGIDYVEIIEKSIQTALKRPDLSVVDLG